MREKMSRILLTGLEKHTPPLIKGIQLQILLNATAAAFGQPQKKTPANVTAASFGLLEKKSLRKAFASSFGQPGKKSMLPQIWHLPQEQALAAYTAYTTACMSGLSASAADKKRIARCAYRLGRKIRRITGFTRQEDLERLVFYLYSNIGIKMTGHLPGEIIIPSCFFSNIYTPDQCKAMSLMDRGVISGICGGGKLLFSERLTQGCGRCRAQLTQKEKACLSGELSGESRGDAAGTGHC